MRGRLSLWVLLASSLTFLASLFLPWRDTHVSRIGGTPDGLLDAIAGNGREIDGWIGGLGDVAVLLVVAVVLGTLAALRRRHLAAKLPIGTLGLALAYFAAAVAVGVHAQSALFANALAHRYVVHTSWTYGFYIGLASAAVAGLCGLAWNGRRLLSLRGAADAGAAALGIVLLASFFLPWVGFGHSSSAYPGIVLPPAAIVVLGVIFGSGWLNGHAGRRWRLPFAVAAAILTGATASALPLLNTHRYGAWIGVGCAVVLVALEAVRARPVRLPVLPRGLAAVRAAAAVLLIAALFLPWQQLQHHPGATGPVATNGWYLIPGAVAGGLCLLLLATPALAGLERFVLDIVVAVVILVSVLGTAFRQETFVFGIGYGAFLGIAAAGILLLTALVRPRAGHVERGRALARAAPLAMSVLCVVAIVLPLWFVLPQDWTFQASPLDYGSWLAVAGLLLALYLVRLWLLRIRGPVHTGMRLTLVPLTLLALASLELIRFREEVVWGAVILVGLCLLLALCGWIEEHSGLEGIRVPEEIWRVDRLPEPES